MMRTRAAVLSGIGAAVAAFLIGIRPVYLGWGATDQERAEPLPGDDMIANVALTATRAITICAPVDQVWPWIAQLGQGRGGFYSYDFLENLVGCDIHSADHIVPEWQHVEAGHKVRLAPEVGLVVAYVERARSFVLRGGIPIGTTIPPYDFTWALVLKGQPTERRDCSCVSDMPISDGGLGCSSNRSRLSAS